MHDHPVKADRHGNGSMAPRKDAAMDVIKLKINKGKLMSVAMEVFLKIFTQEK